VINQSIRLSRSNDGVALAWAEAGEGVALVKAANWLTHLEYDLESPIWRHWVRFFAQHFRFIRYDERGCGMTEWTVELVTHRAQSRDLETVIAAAKPERPFVLLGVSQGGADVVRYAVEHPEHVSHLILYGIYAQGMLRRGDEEAARRDRAILELTRIGWGKDNPVYRRLFTSRFVPEATEAEIGWFDELCRRTTTPEVAAAVCRASAFRRWSSMRATTKSSRSRKLTWSPRASPARNSSSSIRETISCSSPNPRGRASAR
jgi:pimeloyl-ACP methyl ester carboxylesterase